MDNSHDREKSNRRSRGEHRDSVKDHRGHDRDSYHKRRAKEVRSRETDEDHRDSDKHNRSLKNDKHREHSHRDSKHRRSSDRSEREASRGRGFDRDSRYDLSDDSSILRVGQREGSDVSDEIEYRVYDVDRMKEKLRVSKIPREGSSDRDLREQSVEKRHSSRSHKRKHRENSFDGGEKKRIVLSTASRDDTKERSSFDDGVEDDKKLNGFDRDERQRRRGLDDGVKEEVKMGSKEEKRRERVKFGDRVKEESDSGLFNDKKPVILDVIKKEHDDSVDYFQNNVSGNSSGFNKSKDALEPLGFPSNDVLKNSLSPGPDHPRSIKVSSISTTNENKGVSITRSHEVHGKSSTDGSSPVAGKTGSLSLDALAKAKKTLQMQKELSEKLKRIPLLNKGSGLSSSSSSNTVAPQQVGVKSSSSMAGLLPLPVSSASATISVSVDSTSSLLNLSSSAVTSSNAHEFRSIPGLMTSTHNVEVVKRAQELAAKMGFHQDPEFAPLINMFPGQVAATTAAVLQKPAKTPVLRLDAFGREIDEHGNVVNMPKLNNLSTLKVNINKQKKDAFQILKPELDVDPDSNPYYDSSMGIDKNKLLRPKRMTFQFVEEGKWSKDAEIIKLKSQFGEAQAKELKVKQAQFSRAKAEPDINPNLIEVSERFFTKEKKKDPIPEIEWWDVPFLHSASYLEDKEDNLKMDKVSIYVEHPRPINPPAEPAPPPPQPLKLTKREQKKLRTQRRVGREKERQEMIRQGLLELPKPKIKMSNLMRVLGSEATQDPTRLEMEVRSAAAERERAHADRNVARKLTPAERRDKKQRKLFDDSAETTVSVYKVNDLSHPRARFKVDVNAQENRLSGCAVIYEGGASVVVVEGGKKAIKRYGKLMLRRIDWCAAPEGNPGEESGEGNRCVVVWEGRVAKPGFNRFFVHECRTEGAARKVFADAGVAHYWDLAVNLGEE